MTLHEFLEHSTRQIITEGITHVEDLVIDDGSAGAKTALKKLHSLTKDTGTISLKWDGFPAVIFGRDEQGNLVFMDKHMYDKVAKGKMPFMSIEQYDKSRGANREDLWKKEKVFRRVLNNVVPQTANQFWMGDLMWAGKLTAQQGKYAFRPNTVKYYVDAASPLGKQIAASVGGIAVHTFIPGLGQSDQLLVGLKGLKNDAGIVFLQGEIQDKPQIKIPLAQFKKVQTIINKNASLIDQYINDLAAMKGKSVITAMGPFVTSMLEDNDIKTDVVPRFLEFLQSKLSDKAKAQLLGNNRDGWLYQKNGGAPGLNAIWTVWLALTDLKLAVKKQIDEQMKNSDVVAVTNGAAAHEGYVFGEGSEKLKLVDRLGFSRANFAKHRVSPEEQEQAAKQPMAAFCFGRMNPPTVGHELVMKKTVQTGGANSFIFLSNSHQAPDNPLDPKTKTEFIKKIYPQYAKHIVEDTVQSPIYAANWLYARGFRNIAFVGGSDRLGNRPGSIEKILNGWNRGDIRKSDYAFGPNGREHVNLTFVSSGERDADTTSVTGISGSLARKYAAANDQSNFERATGVSSNIKVNGKTLFQATRQGLGLDAEPVITKSVDSQTVKKSLKEMHSKQPVQFHNDLNPALWQQNQMLPEVREHLMQIAKTFYAFLDLPKLRVKDITVSGSNAGYTYTQHSDVDLHLIVRAKSTVQDHLRKYVDAKKIIFNDQHNITVNDQPVEVYVQFEDQPHTSDGIFSVARNHWIQRPEQTEANVDTERVNKVLRMFVTQIRQVIRRKDLSAANRLMKKISQYRKQGLAQQGQFSVANLVFKQLRQRGYLDRLTQFRLRQQDWELSLEEDQL